MGSVEPPPSLKSAPLEDAPSKQRQAAVGDDTSGWDVDDWDDGDIDDLKTPDEEMAPFHPTKVSAAATAAPLQSATEISRERASVQKKKKDEDDWFGKFIEMLSLIKESE